MTKGLGLPSDDMDMKICSASPKAGLTPQMHRTAATPIFSPEKHNRADLEIKCVAEVRAAAAAWGPATPEE